MKNTPPSIIPNLDAFPGAQPVWHFDDIYVTPAGQIISTRRGKAKQLATYWIRNQFRVNVFPKRGSGKSMSARVHYLVTETFHGPRPTPAHRAIHVDCDLRNNSASNLRWALPSEFSDIQVAHGAHVHGETHGNHILIESEVREIKALLAQGQTHASIADRYGVCRSSVTCVNRGKTWRHLDAQDDVSTDVLSGTSEHPGLGGPYAGVGGSSI